MTGSPPPSVPARRKIQALTVSVNYADFLECIAPNVKHFDRWLVVTDEADTRTQDVCRRWGMEVLFSKRLYENDAVFHKAAALNEGLDVLDQDAWVAVLDSDVLLPHDFRERLHLQSLDPECLYGLSGRRICRTLAEFRSLAACEPWADNLIHTTFVIGYFNLFHLSVRLNRYPEHGSDDASTYDVLFSNFFPAIHRHFLPFVCLHAGDSSANWRGRVTDPFFEDRTHAHAASVEPQTGKIAALLGGPDKSAVQIGCWRGETSRALAQHFDRVTVIDHWGLAARAPSAAMATDLEFISARYAAETSGLPNLTAPLEHSAETLASLADGSLDAIWLTAEPEYDFLLHFLPVWLPKLKPGGAIAGGFYEPELLPGPSHVVQLVLGEPDEVFPDMQWVKHLAEPARFLARRLPAPQTDAPRGVVYVCMEEEEIEALLVSLSSLRRHWTGAVCVLNAGDESPPLRLACARLGVDFRNVPLCSTDYPDSLNRLHALDWSPFAESVFLAAATLVTGPVDFLFDALKTQPNAFCPARPGDVMPVTGAAFAWRRSSPVLDAWRAIAGGLMGPGGSGALRMVPGMLLNDNIMHLLPAAPVWDGPAKRAPAGTVIQAFPRLARAGALALFEPWAEEEQALLARLADTE